MNQAVGTARRERVIRTNLPHELGPALGERARLGLIVLASDNTLEYEWRRLLRIDGVAFYESRLYNSPTIAPDTLRQMEGEIGRAAGLILPDVPLDVIAFGCTSGAMAIGEERVFELIREARPDVACTTPITAAFAAFSALGVERVALLTPYAEAVNEMMRDYLEARGIAVPVSGSFSEEIDTMAARITPQSIVDAALDLGRDPAVDAVFVSCTSLRVVEILEEVEGALGKPVTSSNHAMAWHALRLAGFDEALPGRGRLFRI